MKKYLSRKIKVEYEKMSLSQFLEAFDVNTMIEIIDTSDDEIYQGRAGDVKQRILNMRDVILGTTCIVERNIRIYTEKISS